VPKQWLDCKRDEEEEEEIPIPQSSRQNRPSSCQASEDTWEETRRSPPKRRQMEELEIKMEPIAAAQSKEENDPTPPSATAGNNDWIEELPRGQGRTRSIITAPTANSTRRYSRQREADRRQC